MTLAVPKYGAAYEQTQPGLPDEGQQSARASYLGTLEAQVAGCLPRPPEEGCLLTA